MLLKITITIIISFLRSKNDIILILMIQKNFDVAGMLCAVQQPKARQIDVYSETRDDLIAAFHLSIIIN